MCSANYLHSGMNGLSESFVDGCVGLLWFQVASPLTKDEGIPRGYTRIYFYIKGSVRKCSDYEFNIIRFIL